MNYINHNGQIIPTKQAVITAQNRAFRYGDGLFETLRVLHGKIPFIERHYHRLINGLVLLQITIPTSFSLDFFQNEILSLTGKKQLARIRFTAYRSDGGLYLPTQNELHYLIETQAFGQAQYQWNPEGLHTGLFNAIPLAYNLLSSLKSINALPYILAAKHKAKQGWDDIFLLNQLGRLAEAGSSNLFLWDGQSLLTPALKEGCIAGVIRSVILDHSDHWGIPAREDEISIDALKKAKAVLLTNSIQGIRWVRRFSDHYFDENIAAEIGKELLLGLNRLGK